MAQMTPECFALSAEGQGTARGGQAPGFGPSSQATLPSSGKRTGPARRGAELGAGKRVLWPPPSNPGRASYSQSQHLTGVLRAESQ